MNIVSALDHNSGWKATKLLSSPLDFWGARAGDAGLSESNDILDLLSEFLLLVGIVQKVDMAVIKVKRIIAE